MNVPKRERVVTWCAGGVAVYYRHLVLLGIDDHCLQDAVTLCSRLEVLSRVFRFHLD